MNIISTFPFAYEYELEVLLIKLIVEDQGICEWVICENEFTFTGEYKGLHFKKLLDSDRRFDPFRHKITVVEGTKSLNGRNPSTEDELFDCIGNVQREFGIPYILEKYSDDNTRVINADVDEMYDFQGNDRSQIIIDSLKKNPNKAVWLPTRRYWYDFDNYAFTYHFHIMIPLEFIRKNRYRMQHSVNRENSVYVLNPHLGEFAVFEYTWCFSYEDMKKKLGVWVHGPYIEDDLIMGLKCNKKIQKSLRGETSPRYPTDEEPNNHWFEKVELDEHNTPKYVLDSIDKLRTNTVDPDYKENRKIHFPRFFK